MTTKMLRFRLLDAPDLIVKKIETRSKLTLITRCVTIKENKPGISNLMGIYRAITKDSYEAIEEMYAGKGYGAFKSDIADLLVATLEPNSTTIQ